jgi:murein L,D-transpeptidase YcbB/YkuD
MAAGNDNPHPTMTSLLRLTSTALILGASAIAAPARAQGAMELVVNIPAGRLDVLQGGERVRSYPVSVGRARYATPTGSTALRRMVWNPTWTPPPGAAWARKEKPAGPGWANPMGRVKIHLFGDYYVHGTPAGNERHLGSPASHGCIRMRNADVMELARMILRADGSPIAESTLEHLASTPRATREVALAGRVRARIEYRLTEVAADSVTILPDVYARTGSAYATQVGDELRRAGADPAPVLARLGGSRPATALRIARTPEALLPDRAVTVALASR